MGAASVSHWRAPDAGPARKPVLFGAIVGSVVALDFASKLVVQRTMSLYDQIEVIGGYVRLTYIYNPGAAFGLHLGPHSREIFLVLSLVALLALAAMYWLTPATDRGRLIAIALICAGAIGNLIDRVRSSAGVIDFIDIGVGDTRWPVFNVADIAVTTGAVLLAISLWKEDRKLDGDG